MDRKDNTVCSAAPRLLALLPQRPARLVLALCLACGALPQSVLAQDAVVQLRLPSQALGDALLQLADQYALDLAYSPDIVAGLSAPDVSGALTADQALSRVLAGTGIEFRRNGSRVSLYRPAPDNAEQLAPVVVRGSYGPTTEATGSYTTRTTSAATGLALSLRHTPQSVSVLTRQQLDDQNPLTLGEAIKNVTGIHANSSDSDRTDIWSRGFYVDSYQYDGVPVSTANDFFGASNFDTVLYDRIEVVRGATGLMSGAGNPGASVNLVRKRASSKVFTGSATLGIGTWDHRRATLDLSVPLTEDGRVRARVAGMTESRDSHLDRYHARNRAVLATMEADLTDATTVRAGIEHQAKRPTNVTWGGVPMLSSDGSPLDWSRNFSIAADWTYWNTTNDTVFAALEHRFDNAWQLTANASRIESDFESRLLYLMGQPDAQTGVGVSVFPNYAKQQLAQNNFSLMATGPFSLLGRQHEAVVGLLGSSSRYIFGNHAYGTPADVGNLFQWDGSYPEPVWGAYRQLGNDRTRQLAAYAALRLSLTDALRLVVGGRQNRWKLDGLTAERSHDVFTPYAGIIYDFSEVYSGYVSYTDIFQPQDYRNVDNEYLDPVVGKSYEVGIKGEHLDGRLNSSFSVFRIDQDNVAERDGTNLIEGTTDFAYVGVKGVKSRGFEIQVAGDVTEGWNISAGFSRTLSKKADGTPLTSFKPNNELHLFTSYRLPGDWNKLTVGGGVKWRDQVSMPLLTSSGVGIERRQGSIALFSLMANYQFTQQFSAQLNVSNLFDKTYFDLASDGLGYYGSPRKTMLTAKYQF